MRLVPVFIIKMYNQTNYKYLIKFVQRKILLTVIDWLAVGHKKYACWEDGC